MAMQLSDWRIVRKVALLGAALTLVALAMGGAGTWAVRTLLEDVRQIDSAADSALLAARKNIDAVQMDRLAALAATGRPEAAAALRGEFGAEAAEFRERLRQAAADAGPRRAALLARIAPAFETYAGAAEAVLAAATRSPEEARAAFAAARPTYDALRRSLIELADLSAAIAEQEKARAAAQAAAGQAMLAGGALVAILTAGLLTWWLGLRATARPMAQSVARLSALAEGDTAAPIPGAGRRDEVGDLAAAMAVFRERLIENREAVARDRAEAEAKAQRAERLAAAAARFETAAASVVKGVAAAATELATTATALQDGAAETLREAATVTDAAQDATGNVQSVAAATDELSASIGEITRQVSDSTRMAAEAAGQAAHTNREVEALAQAAARISEVVRLINDIAGQTNLLALNATIEAARAGEAGKGFAVVASEVKNLAAQTAKATDEIGAQIAAVQGETAKVVDAIRGIGGTIERMSSFTSAIAAAVEQQGAATSEIARSVQHAANGTATVTSRMVGVRERAEHSGQAATDVTGAASELSRGAETLRRQVEAFLDEVKAA
jgi:methyl-accepting chemotaxis protein